MGDLDSLLAGLGTVRRGRGRDFERLCKWLLENAPLYAARVGRVWLWDEWPGRWAADAGIDLVAEDRDGGLWAVQAKHYDPAYAIRKADLDSFLSESSRPGFTYRLLIASTDHLGATARRTLDGQEKPVGTLLRSDLAALDLPWPRSLASLRVRTFHEFCMGFHQFIPRASSWAIRAGDNFPLLRFLHDGSSRSC